MKRIVILILEGLATLALTMRTNSTRGGNKTFALLLWTIGQESDETPQNRPRKRASDACSVGHGVLYVLLELDAERRTPRLSQREFRRRPPSTPAEV